jgi:hypothetical protein
MAVAKLRPDGQQTNRAILLGAAILLHGVQQGLPCGVDAPPGVA